MRGKRWRAGDVPAVCVVAPGGADGPGGIGRLVAYTVRRWRRAGMRPALRVVDPYGSGALPDMLLHLARALVRIAWEARRGSIAMLHVHMAARGSAVRKGMIVFLGKRLGLPVLLHLHGSRMDEFLERMPLASERLVRRVLLGADRVVVVGEHWRRFVTERLAIDPAKLRVVANAAEGPERPPAKDGGPPRLLFLGTLSARKGLPELLQALAGPRCVALAWRLAVAGEGDADAYGRRARELGIAERIDFLGSVPEARARELLAAADVFVLPSHNEGLSIALLEAMANGCAIVTTPVGANLDAVSDGVSALVVPSGDPERLAAALARVVGDAALRAELQAAARRRFCEAFDIGLHCERLAALYREMCPALAAIDEDTAG
jgi:glycosyltransferase involved in cell wall biosynthesis